MTIVERRLQGNIGGRGEAKIPVGNVLRQIRNTSNSAPWKGMTKRLKYLKGKKKNT